MVDKAISGAELLVDSMIEHGVEYIFCVPGASVDPILDVLIEKGPKVVLCHHESCAGYMAQAWGKITGKPGVVMVTAGPGATNLVSAMATAFTERSPIIAITGQISSLTKYKLAHQAIDSSTMMAPITKWSIEIDDVETLTSVFIEAYRLSLEHAEGPVHIAIPSDILTHTTQSKPLSFTGTVSKKFADPSVIQYAADKINQAKRPILFLGCSASKPSEAAIIQDFVEKSHIPVVCTFEGAGVISRKLEKYFMGRLGLFRNQPGDRLLDKADIIITVGYNIAEIDPLLWNMHGAGKVIHIDESAAIIGASYNPEIQIIGDIAKNIDSLTSCVQKNEFEHVEMQKEIRQELEKFIDTGEHYDTFPLHPLRIIHDMKQVVTDKNTVISDVGSHQYWMAERFYCYQPKYFLTSMGFQTMGISLPYAIATSLLRPKEKIFSVSGDGSFLMCGMELATAVRLKAPIIHLIWKDGSFNLVKIQQEKKYGRHNVSVFDGGMDFAKYAESMGAVGFSVKSADELLPILKEALKVEGPVIIDIPVDYSGNSQLVTALPHKPCP